MARLVLDTNSLLQCISRRSKYHDLWLSLLDGRNELCVSTEILEEYAEILERKTSPKFAELALDVISNNPYTVFITPYYHFKLIVADPDDDKFVDCIISPTFLSFFPLHRGIREGLGRKNGSRADFRFLFYSLKQIREPSRDLLT